VTKKTYKRGRARRERIAQLELQPLSRLIKATFNDISFRLNSAGLPYASAHDRLDPTVDGCLNKEPWDFGVEGDFYFVIRDLEHVYIVFGDASGHFDYAGGIKLFVAMALQRAQAQGSLRRARSALGLVKWLAKEFRRVGRLALKRNADEPLADGANAIAVHVNLRNRRADYASAGIPVRAVGLDGNSTLYGKMIDGLKILSFPDKPSRSKPLSIESGELPLKLCSYLVFVTDGFEELGRSKQKGVEKPDEKMGARGVEKALHTAFKPSSKASPPASELVKAVIKYARRWRRDHFIPEISDDDRLVLALDVRKLLQILPPRKLNRS
jgi:hypothetical protein